MPTTRPSFAEKTLALNTAISSMMQSRRVLKMISRHRLSIVLVVILKSRTFLSFLQQTAPHYGVTNTALAHTAQHNTLHSAMAFATSLANNQK